MIINYIFTIKLHVLTGRYLYAVIDLKKFCCFSSGNIKAVYVDQLIVYIPVSSFTITLLTFDLFIMQCRMNMMINSS